MTYAARHAGTVKQGQLVLADPASWRAAVARHEGRTVWVSLVRQQHARTLPQNKLYWVWVREIAGFIGGMMEKGCAAMKATLDSTAG